MGMLNRLTLADLQKRETEQPEWFEEVIAETIDGQPLYKFLEDQAMTRQGWLMWLAAHEEFKKRWDAAMIARKELRQERVTQKIYDRAMTDDVDVTESGLIAASKMILGDRQTVQHEGSLGFVVKIEASDANL